MEHLKLRWDTDAPFFDVNDLDSLHPDETPVRFERGETLTHIIEGWTLETDTLTAAIGTVASSAYTTVPSYPVPKTYAAETLLLKNVIITPAMTFRSYRTDTVMGLPTYILKLVYEYKSQGWQKFYRNDSITNQSGYYGIRYNSPPYGLINPFPVSDHSKWLA